MAISLLLRRLLNPTINPHFPFLTKTLKPYYYSTLPSPDASSNPNPSSLSVRMSFVFDQIDAIERQRLQKDQTLQRIRAWRESKNQQEGEKQENAAAEETVTVAKNTEVGLDGNGQREKREVEVVHPWAEWIELMERLVRQNYFDHRRTDEAKIVQNLGIVVNNDDGGIGEGGEGDIGIDFKDFKTVQTACLNFGKDRFDILRSLSRQDIQHLVGYGCPGVDRKLVYSAKVLRKHVHLDEGDVCSNCSLRSSCERAFLLLNKEDEARTIDVMRVLLTYGFDSINGLVLNKSLLKQKPVKTAVRKLLHEVVKLSAVPIDPNLPPPVIKRPPPKVKQPPPPPKKRVGRDDIEMKKGDWLCPKCDFMNFAKNTVCLQCDAKRPKRQLLPGEWECPECNFLNYRRNMTCFHCECKRPSDEYIEQKMEDKQGGPKTRLEKIANCPEVSNAWNFDFDDDESDGADVAAFEYADSSAVGVDSPLGSESQEGNFRGHDDDINMARRFPGANEREYSELARNRPGMGFDDFDDEDDVDSYELDSENNNRARRAFQDKFSEQEISELEDVDTSDTELHNRQRTSAPKHKLQKAAFPDSENDELDIDSDCELSVHPKWKSSHVADTRHKNRCSGPTAPSRGLSFGSDDELELDSDADDDFVSGGREDNKWGSRRKKFQRSSDLENVSFSGSESDGNYPGNRSAGNRLQNGKRGNKSRSHGDYAFESDTRGRSKGKMGDRRNSWDDDFARSLRSNHDKNRGFRDNGHGDYDFRSDVGFRSKSKMRDGRNSWDDDFGRSSRRNHGKNRGFRDNGRGDYDFGSDSGGRYKGRTGDRRNSWNDDSDGSHGNHGRNRGFRDNGRGGRRMNDRGGDSWDFKESKGGGFQNRKRGGRSHDSTTDRDRDFGEFSNSRRVIER